MGILLVLAEHRCYSTTEPSLILQQFCHREGKKILRIDFAVNQPMTDPTVGRVQHEDQTRLGMSRGCKGGLTNC